MAIGDLPLLKQFFAQQDDAATQEALFRETLLMTLSRATRADAATDDDEVDAVRCLLKERLGEDVSVKDIRVAASSELFETTSIDKYLTSAATRLSLEQRQSIISALITIFHADGKISESEVAFFDMTAQSLRLSPSELVGLKSS